MMLPREHFRLVSSMVSVENLVGTVPVVDEAVVVVKVVLVVITGMIGGVLGSVVTI